MDIALSPDTDSSLASLSEDASPVCDGCRQSIGRPIDTLRFEGYPGLFKLRQCDTCGLVFNWPRLNERQISEQYAADYYVFTEPPWQRWTRATQEYIEHLLPIERRVEGRRLLEIGSASGELLAIAAARGWEVTGVEISDDAAQRAREAYAVDVRVGTIERRSEELDVYDVVIACDVIEHVSSPRGFLKALGQVVTPGGRVIIETPNWDSPWRRWGRSAWLGFNRFHIYLFNESSLSRLLEDCGFKDIRVATTTSVIHTAWGERPELQSLLRWIPPALRWRTKAKLNKSRLSPLARNLRSSQPADLDEALRTIKPWERPAQTRAIDARHRGDNLVVRASRGVAS
jgi:SAM-dependent methyltransferase